MKIAVGSVGAKNVSFDLDTLLRTRLLIQANSGKGKSWLLRRLAEQMSGHVQVIIIDPEGEFATLREKYDYALIGKGGDGAAHPRIAALTAQRLLEVRASAVCDLYEMKPSERHSYVKLFLEALIDAPKSLWHPLVVILDEAHVYCPEKGAGESEAAESVISLATRGRKRGYCLIPATQRLGKFRKDAAAEMLNVAIGGTFIDIDRKRAADALGVYGSDQHEFFDEIRLLERGNFYMLGPAVSDQRILVKVGSVQTTHPEAGSSKHSAGPPPPTEKIKALLPKLIDLPKEAEQKAKTEAELRTEIRSLKGQLSARPKEVQEKVVEKTVEVLAVPQKQIDALTAAAQDLQKAATLIQQAIQSIPRARPAILSARSTPALAPRPAAPRPTREPLQNGDGDLSGPERRILNAIAWLNTVGIDQPEQTAVAFLAGYSIGGGAFNNPRGRLNQRGFVEYLAGDRIRLTADGAGIAEPPAAPLDAAELQRMVMERLPGPERKILAALIDSPEGLANDELAERSGYTPGGGAFNNPKGRLRSLGLIEYSGGKVLPKPLLFLETA